MSDFFVVVVVAFFCFCMFCLLCIDHKPRPVHVGDGAATTAPTHEHERTAVRYESEKGKLNERAKINT